MVTDVSGSSRGFTAGGAEKLPGSTTSLHANSCCGYHKLEVVIHMFRQTAPTIGVVV